MREAVRIQSIVRRAAGLSLVAAALLVATGCGNGLAEVTGAITVDGQTLTGGNDVRVTVTFQPSSGPGRVAVGLADGNGNYRLSSGSQEGVVPGEYLATCSATQIVRGKEGGVTGGRRLTDPSYANIKTSGFKFTVTPGSNQIDLALNSRAGMGVGN
jgi:hypothetical protein